MLFTFDDIFFSFSRLLSQPPTVFSQHINRNHLNECLDQLLHLYDEIELRLPEVNLSGRPEIEALSVLVSKNTDGVTRGLRLAKSETVVNVSVQISLNLWLGNFHRAHRLSRQLPLVLQLAYHVEFAQLRLHVLQIYHRAHRSAQGSKFPLEKLAHLLLVGSDKETADFCHLLGLAVEDNQVIFKTGTEPKAPDAATTSHKITELKLLHNVRPSHVLLHGKSL